MRLTKIPASRFAMLTAPPSNRGSASPFGPASARPVTQNPGLAPHPLSLLRRPTGHVFHHRQSKPSRQLAARPPAYLWQRGQVPILMQCLRCLHQANLLHHPRRC
ncbi:hypothetical protein MRX96_053075 [Rhipicephalus microplus]